MLARVGPGPGVVAGSFGGGVGGDVEDLDEVSGVDEIAAGVRDGAGGHCRAFLGEGIGAARHEEAIAELVGLDSTPH